MFKKICSFIILIIMTISLVSVFVYPVYRIKSEEILTEGSFIETLNECGYLENNDYEISNDIYLTDLMKMFVSYVKYDYDIYRTLESKTFVGKMNELFTQYDGMIMPVGTGPARYLDTTKNEINNETRVLEESLQIANHGGYPSITIPNGFVNNLPVGVNITCAVKEDEKLLQIANTLESNMDYKNQLAGGER